MPKKVGIFLASIYQRPSPILNGGPIGWVSTWELGLDPRTSTWLGYLRGRGQSPVAPLVPERGSFKWNSSDEAPSWNEKNDEASCGWNFETAKTEVVLWYFLFFIYKLLYIYFIFYSFFKRQIGEIHQTLRRGFHREWKFARTGWGCGNVTPKALYRRLGAGAGEMHWAHHKEILNGN